MGGGDAPLSVAGTFLCGWAGGAAGCVASQPLDTIRIRLQVSGGPAAGSGALRAAATNQLFAGVFLPTMLVGVWKGIIFCGYDQGLRAVGAGRGGADPTLTQVALASWWGGLLGTLCNTPYDAG